MANDLDFWLLATLRKRRRRHRRQFFLKAFAIAFVTGFIWTLTQVFKGLGVDIILGLLISGLVIAIIILMSLFVVQVIKLS